MSAFPRLGLTSAGLFYLRNQLWAQPSKPWREMTTKEAVERFIKPLTAGTGKTWCELHEGKLCPNGTPVVAPATVFASHSWGETFDGLFFALAKFANGAKEATVASGSLLGAVFWLDFLALDQHGTGVTTTDYLTDTLSKGIASIGSVALVLDLTTVLPFTRCWCIWELACAVTNRVPVTAASTATHGQDDPFMTRMARAVDPVADVQGLVARIDIRKARAFKPEDESAIFEAVGASNFGACNELAKQEARKGLIIALCRMTSDEWYAKAFDSVTLLRMYPAIAHLLRQQGLVEPESVRAFIYPRQPAATRACCVATCLMSLGLFCEAEEELRVYARDVSTRIMAGQQGGNVIASVVPDHNNAASRFIADNIGNAWCPDKLESELFRMASYAVHLLARLYELQGKHGEALTAYEALVNEVTAYEQAGVAYYFESKQRRLEDVARMQRKLRVQ